MASPRSMASPILPEDVAFTFLRDLDLPPEDTAHTLWQFILSRRVSEDDLESWRNAREDPQTSTTHDLLRAMPICGFMNVPDITNSLAREIAHRLVRMGELGVLETTLSETGDMRGMSALEGDQIQAIVAYIEPLFYLRAVCARFRQLTDDAMHAVLATPVQHLRCPLRTFLSHTRIWYKSMDDGVNEDDYCARFYGLELPHSNCTIYAPDFDLYEFDDDFVVAQRVFRIDEWARDVPADEFPAIPEDGTIVPSPDGILAADAEADVEDIMWAFHRCVPKPTDGDEDRSIRYLRDDVWARSQGSADTEMTTFLRMATRMGDDGRPASLFPGELGSAITTWLAQTAAPADIGNHGDAGEARLLRVSNFVKYHAFCGYVRESEMGAVIADRPYTEFLNEVCGGRERNAWRALDAILVLACLLRYVNLAENFPRPEGDDRDISEIYMEEAIDNPHATAVVVEAGVISPMTSVDSDGAMEFWPTARKFLFPELFVVMEEE